MVKNITAFMLLFLIIILTLPLLKVKFISNTPGDYYDYAHVGFKWQIYNWIENDLPEFFDKVDKVKEYMRNVLHFNENFKIYGTGILIITIVINTLLFRSKEIKRNKRKREENVSL